MKKSYTKDQIVEAITYWTRQLKLMSESCEKCTDALMSEFGYGIVTSSEFTYNLTKDDLERMYDVLNFTLFNNELGHIRLEYWPEKMIISKLNEHAEKVAYLTKKHILPHVQAHIRAYAKMCLAKMET